MSTHSHVPSTAVPADDRSRDIDRITELVDAAARHQFEPDPFLELHSEDVVVINMVGRRVLGRAALESAMRAALASPLAKVTTRVEIDDIRFLGPDVAIVSCTKYVEDQRDGSTDELPASGAMTYVVEAAGEGWRIALAQTTPMRT